MPSDKTQFVTNAAAYVLAGLGSRKMQQAVRTYIKGSGTGTVNKTSTDAAVVLARNLLAPCDDDQIVAGRINTWLSVINTNLGASIPTNMNTLAANANYIYSLDQESLDCLELYWESSLLFAKMNG